MFRSSGGFIYGWETRFLNGGAMVRIRIRRVTCMRVQRGILVWQPLTKGWVTP